MKLSIVIPVYNEERTLAKALSRVLQAPCEGMEKEVLAIDDGSTDRSLEILASFSPPVRIIRHSSNQGKGASLRDGFAAATGEVLLVQDADLEYNPEDYPRLLKPILDGRARVVYGSRFTGERSRMLWVHTMGNRFLTFLTNLLYGSRLSDMETGYKVFHRSALDGIQIESRDFREQPELTVKWLRRGIPILEVPISYRGREHTEGKKIKWMDGVLAALWLIRYRFRR